MKCPRCSAPNQQDARFCEDCGARLELSCPSCGQPVTPGKKFCRSCGAAVSARATASSPASYTPKHLAEKILTSKAALEGERKQVTVLFADLKGSMELLADRDPEEARKILDPVLEHMMEAVHRYEGTVNQVMGDGIMALFGAPLAHEDHAVRACYAALRMQDSVKRYAEDVHRSHGINVQIRVGLNSGEVVVRTIGNDLHMDYTAVGQTTHLAARIEEAAPPASVLITGETLRLAGGFVEVRHCGAIPVKGLRHAVEAYELAGPGPARSRLMTRAARHGLTPFVGRAAEMERLTQVLEWVRAGHGQVVGVAGEPGVGKSRLVHEFTSSPRTSGWLVMESSSSSLRDSTPYRHLIDLLAAYFQISPGDDDWEIRKGITTKVLALDSTLESALPAFLALLDIVPEDRTWEALDPPQRRRQTLDSIRRLLLKESQVQPVLLVFEDLHWIDSGSQAGLDLLVESLSDARILVLVSYRPPYAPGWERLPYFTAVSLDPLSTEKIGDLLDVTVGRDPSVSLLRPLLAARTEGNPFFLEESVQTLVEAGALAGEPGAYRLTRPVTTIEVPATVETVLAARIDSLSPEDKRLLQAASVIGQEVPFVILEAVADRTEVGIHEGLARLQSAELLHEVRLFPDAQYAFKHALTHEVAYHSLLKTARREYHREIAQALEERVPGTAETRPELLAHHWAEAGVHERAVGLWQRAGRRAIERSAHAEAIRHLTRGLEALETLPDTDERARRAIALHLLLANSISALHGYGRELMPICTRLRELAPRAGTDPVTQLRVLVPEWMFHAACGPLTKARAVAEAGLSLAERAGISGWIVACCAAMAHTLRSMGEFASAVEVAERGLALYDPEQHSPRALRADEDPGARLMRDRAASLWPLGYSEEALRQMRQAVSHARSLSHPYSLGWALVSMADLFRLAREPHAVREATEEALALSRDHGFGLLTGWVEALRGWVMFADDDRRQGIAALQASLSTLRASGMLVGLPGCLLSLAVILAADGQSREALLALDEAASVIMQTGEHQQDSLLHRLKGEILLQADDERGAEREACESISAARRQGARLFELGAATSLARLLARRGEPGEAMKLLGGIVSWFAKGFDTADLRDAKELLDQLSTAPL
jgi:class 3 adenylate cyclase/tetratricopeptide (TPR) repeat protein